MYVYKYVFPAYIYINDRGVTIDGRHVHVMAPMADLFNHRLFDRGGTTLQLKVDQEIFDQKEKQRIRGDKEHISDAVHTKWGDMYEFVVYSGHAYDRGEEVFISVIYVCVFVYVVCVYIYIYICVCVCVCVRECVYVFMSLYDFVVYSGHAYDRGEEVFISVICVCVCMYIYMCVYVCVCP
jgi:hypothetical protein